MRRVDVRNALIRRRLTSIRVSGDIRAPETGLRTCFRMALGCQQAHAGVLDNNISNLIKFFLMHLSSQEVLTKLCLSRR